MTAVMLDDVLGQAVERWGSKPCIELLDGSSVTYEGLDRRAWAFAHALRERGTRPGDRVLLANYNTIEFFAALFGAARAGITAIPIDPALSPVELQGVIAHATPHAVIVDDRHAATFVPLGIPSIHVAEIPLVAPGGATARERTDVAVILYTSGTTGTPRGAMHSHDGLVRKVEDIKARYEFDESSRNLCLLPTHFGHGLVCNCLSTLGAGGTLVLCRPFDVQLLSQLTNVIEQRRVQMFSSVPTVVRLLLRYAERHPPPPSAHLRFVTCASAPLHVEEVEAFEARFGVPLLNCYGITEGGTWSAMSPRDPARDKTSVGMAWRCRFRAVDANGAALPEGQIGELQLSGPSVMLGYYRDPEATARALTEDRWLRTGDLGRVDGEGRVFLAGRLKELIIRAGVNIYPAEVESALLSHPDVAEAYVVGLADPILGEKVGACVVAKPGVTPSVAALVQHCRGRLASYKCPETVKLLETVPKTSRGKVNKARLKDLFAATSSAAGS